MLRFIVRRLVGMVLVLFACSVLVFLIFMVAPGGGTDAAARRIAGKNATPALIANVKEDFGFDKPLPVQYTTMMKKVFNGELIQYSPRIPVDNRIKEGIPATLSLSIGAGIIWLAFGLLLGYLSAIRAGGWLDRTLTGVAIAGISIPVFLLAPVLIYFLTYKLEIFPNGGYVGLTEDPWGWLQHLILPWFTLAVLSIGFYSRVLRSNMLDVMNEDYVRTARAKGLSERRVMTRHVLRNSLIPIVTLFGLDFGATIAGTAIITEVLFNIEGIGSYAAESIKKLELPPIMGITLYGAFFVVFINALVDITYAYLDPRVRLGSSAR
jgi:peptide/nickel transport system permease protein